ncbi:hypothetical protein JCM10212_001701 [Sporobolomyces blumeae]
MLPNRVNPTRSTPHDSASTALTSPDGPLASAASQWVSDTYRPPRDALARTESDVERDGDGRDDADDSRVTPDLMRIAVVAGLGGLLFGFDTGVVSGALVSIGTALSPNHDEPLTTSQESWLVTSALFGALAASLVAGRLADRVGRKKTIVAAAVLFALGAAEMAAAQVYKEVILGRVFVGLAVGLASCVLPTYLAELSPPKYRGRLVASLVVLITGGQVVAYVVDALFVHVEKGWRFMFGFGIVPAVFQLVFSFALPESPRFLQRRGRTAQARSVVARLNPTWSPNRVQKELDSITGEAGYRERDRGVREESDSGSFLARIAGRIKGLRRVDWQEKRAQLGAKREEIVALVWDDRANRRALAVACGLQFWQQATGFNCLMYYSTKIIQQTHLSKPATFALLIALSNFACTIVALRLIDHAGRRQLLLRGLVGMLAGMVVLSVSFAFVPLEPSASQTARAGPAAVFALSGMVVFCCSYALSLGNVPWVVQSEVFNQDLKALGTSSATGVNWFANVFVSGTFLHISQGIGPSGAFGVFAGICAAAWVFTFLYLPETKGLSLEQVRAVFERATAKDGQTRTAGAASRQADEGEAERLVVGDGAGYHVVGGDEDDAEDDEHGQDSEMSAHRQ